MSLPTRTSRRMQSAHQEQQALQSTGHLNGRSVVFEQTLRSSRSKSMPRPVPQGTSQRVLPPQTLARLKHAGSDVPVPIIRRTPSRPQVPPVSDTELEPTPPKPRAAPPVRPVSRAPAASDTEPDAPPKSRTRPMSVLTVSAVAETPQGLPKTHYFIRQPLRRIAPDLEWEHLEQLHSFKRQIAQFLRDELAAREIGLPVTEDYASWLEASQALETHDGPNLVQIMNRIRPAIARYVSHSNPSPWDILWTLQTNPDASDAIMQLDLSNLELSTLPLCLKHLSLPRVTYLNLSNNQLQDIPLFLFTLIPNVWTLLLSNNCLSTYSPHLLMQLPSLFRLSLSNNQISAIPPDLGVQGANRISPYTQLDLSHNRIDDLPPLSDVTNRLDLLMYGNPVEKTKDRLQSMGNNITLVWKPLGSL